MRQLSLARLWVLMVTAFVDQIGFALILPLLPFYATRFGADATTVGVLMAAFAFGQLISAPFWGRLSDRTGRRPVIIGGLCLAALAFGVFAVADAVWMLLVCRLLQGMGSGTLSASNAYVSDAVGPDERAQALGWITACTSAGTMIGPAIGSWTVGWHPAAPGLVAMAFCLLNVAFAWRWLPESSAVGNVQTARRPLAGAIWSVLRHPTEPRSVVIWTYSAGMAAFMGMNAVMALYLEDRFGITEHTIGWFYVVVGGLSVVMRGLVLGTLVRRFGEVRVLRTGALLLAVGMCLAPLAASPWGFLVAMVVVPTGTAMLFPSTTSLVSRYCEPEEVGQSLGVQQGFGGMSRLAGPLVAGAVFQFVGAEVPFWLGAALVFAAALCALRLTPRSSPG
ncbi:MAG: MFS transporter [Thermoanaerobaculia bacterium]|nr:MFS transporter [Thermoanaerobaculia bacterium]